MPSPIAPQYLCECGHRSYDHDPWPDCRRCKCRKWREDRTKLYDPDQERKRSMPAKKKGKKKVAKAKSSDKAAARQEAREAKNKLKAEQAKEVVKLRKSGLSFKDVAKKMKFKNINKAIKLYNLGSVEQDITGSEDAVAKKVVHARDKEEQGWAQIAARMGKSIPAARKAYAKGSGKDWRGGRTKKAKAPKAKADKKSKKEKKAKAEPKKGSKFDAGGTEQEIIESLAGRTVTLERADGRTEKVKVDHASKVGKSAKTGRRIVQFFDVDQKARTVALESIKSVR